MDKMSQFMKDNQPPENNLPIGFVGKMATFFIHHRELGLLMVIGIFLWGLFSFGVMSKQYNPAITAPAFTIMTAFPGASSDEVYELITRPMEDVVREIPTVDKVMAQSHDGGASIVTVQFYIGENIEDAKATLAQKLTSNQDQLPRGAKEPHVVAIDPDDVPMMTLALTSDTLSSASVRKAAFDIADELKHVKNTSVIDIVGGREKHLIIDIDPAKLAEHDLSLSQVMGVITMNNASARAGAIETQGTLYNVTIEGNITSIEDLENIVVTQKGKSPILVSDVATVSYDHGEVTEHVRFGDKDNAQQDAVYIAISKLKGSNSTTVADALLAEFDALKGDAITEDVTIAVVRNEGQVAREATTTLTQNLFTAIVIVAAVLLLFLGWKSAAIILVSIPLTLATVFGVGNLFGQSINRITLFALILSLGILVDAAIVVVENIFRLFRENPRGARIPLIARAADEIGPGLIMSTATVILAFIPMAFISGMMGPYMKPIPFFVPTALVASMLIALTIIPYLLHAITKKSPALSDDEKEKKPSIFVRGIDWLREHYVSFLKSLLGSSKKRWLLMSGAVVLLVIAFALPATKVVQFRMLPKADTEQFYIYVDLPDTAALTATQDAARGIEDLLLQDPYVTSVQSFIGAAQIVDFNGLFKGSDGRIGENQATLKVNLVHHNDRSVTSEQIALDLRDDLTAYLIQMPDVRFKIIEDPPGPPVLSTFLVKTQGDDIAVSEQITQELADTARSFDEVVDVDTSKSEQTYEHILAVDHQKASRAGLSAQAITQSLYTVLSGAEVGLYHQSATDTDVLRKPEQEYIIVRTSNEQRDEAVDLDSLFLTNAQGQSVPLSEVTRNVERSVAPVIYSDNRYKTHYISAEMGERSVVYGMIDMLVFLVKDYRLPSGNGEVTHWSLYGVTYEDSETGEEYRVLLDGEWKLTLEVFRDLGIAMGVALIAIYFLLVARFRSLVVPAIIMGTIPLSFIGVLFGFALLGATNGIYFNATSMIGVIALSGIVVNNAIILLEYLNRLKAEGSAIDDAIVQAGRTRLLPIILTTLTTILGSLTIIADPVWEGLAWAIVWGLSLSAFLTLIIFPILYFKFERKHWGENDKC